MNKSFTEGYIVGFLRQADGGVPVKGLSLTPIRPKTKNDGRLDSSCCLKTQA